MLLEAFCPLGVMHCLYCLMKIFITGLYIMESTLLFSICVSALICPLMGGLRSQPFYWIRS